MLLSVLGTYVLTVFLFLLTPGPVNLAVVQAVARYGMKGGWLAVLGSNTASLVLIALAVLLMRAGGSLHAQFLDVLSALGGGYLLYYGYQQWRTVRTRPSTRQADVCQAGAVAEVAVGAATTDSDANGERGVSGQRACHSSGMAVWSPWGVCRQAFAVGISNPKDVIFFMTFFPPFVLELNMPFGQAMGVLVLLWCVLDYTILLAYAAGMVALTGQRNTDGLVAACAVLFMLIGLFAIGRPLYGWWA